MALIYECDKCGATYRVSGIVNNLHKQHGYEQLAAPIAGVVDVCKPCYEIIVSAKMQAEREKRTTVRERMFEILDIRGDV